MEDTGKAGFIVIGVDTKQIVNCATGEIHILSYQYAGRSVKGCWSGVVYPKCRGRNGLLSLVELIGKAIEDGRRQRCIGRKWPKEIHAAAHLSRDAASSFRDFNKFKNQIDSIHNTFVTLREPIRCRYNDASNNGHDLSITLIDTALIAPDGTDLDTLGDLYRLSKIELPQGLSGEMERLLEIDRDLYERYVVLEAEVAALHAWKMTEFARNHMGMDRPPITLGSLAVRQVQVIWEDHGISQSEVIGTERKRQRSWSSKQNRYTTRTEDVFVTSVHGHLALAGECFHGGRNESYIFGFTPLSLWTDFDLAGAYTTAMTAIRMPDYEAIRVSYDPSDYRADVLGLARIRFRFSSAVRFPCIPVRTEHGLVFPLEGTAHVGSPEIHLALDMGAEVTIEHGIIVPWKSDIRPFEVFAKSIRDHRACHEKGSLEERTWKEIGNSLYGKLAQGIQKKRVFDARSQDMKELRPSVVTQPYLAAYTTSIVRAVLGEILHRVPSFRTVVSATTDGFITDAHMDELDLTGPLCRLFSDLRVRLSGDPAILEVKHIAMQLLSWKTRGQATVDTLGQALSLVLAKAGIKPPASVVAAAFAGWDHPYGEPPPKWLSESAANIWVVDTFLERTADTELSIEMLRSMRGMVADNGQLTRKTTSRRLNMEYDWKRELIEPGERAPGVWNKDALHFCAVSRPWQTIEQFTQVRREFDRWRLDRRGVLKTLSDWHAWTGFLKSGEPSRKGIRRGRNGTLGQAHRTVLKAYATAMWGLPGGDYERVATIMTDAGYPTKIDDLKNAKRSTVAVVEHAFDAESDIVQMVRVVLRQFPSFEWKKLIAPGDWSAVEVALGTLASDSDGRYDEL